MKTLKLHLSSRGEKQNNVIIFQIHLFLILGMYMSVPAHLWQVSRGGNHFYPTAIVSNLASKHGLTGIDIFCEF